MDDTLRRLRCAGQKQEVVTLRADVQAEVGVGNVHAGQRTRSLEREELPAAVAAGPEDDAPAAGERVGGKPEHPLWRAALSLHGRERLGGRAVPSIEVPPAGSIRCEMHDRIW